MKQEPRSPDQGSSFGIAGITISEKAVFLKELNHRYRIRRNFSLTGGFFVGLGALALGGAVLFAANLVREKYEEWLNKLRDFSLIDTMKEWFDGFFTEKEEEEEPSILTAPSMPVQSIIVPPEARSAESKRTAPSTTMPTLKAKPQEHSKASDTALTWYKADDFGVKGIPSAINYASKLTGVNPSVLYAFAFKESRFGKIMANKSTSAKGVFQLLSSTFEDIQKRYGKKYPILKEGIHNIKASATAAALMIRDLSQAYRRKFGTTPSVTDLYMMYLLGPSGGLRFLDMMHKKPSVLAVKVFERAAKHNRSVFFDGSDLSRPRTLYGVYQYLHREVGEVANRLSFVDKSMPPAKRAETEDYKPVSSSIIPKQERVVPVPISQRTDEEAKAFRVRFDAAPSVQDEENSETAGTRLRTSSPQALIRYRGMILSVEV